MINTVWTRLIAQPVQLVAVILATAILVSLGNWQLQRLEWKRDLIAKSEARVSSTPKPFNLVFEEWRGGEDREYVPVVIEGQFRDDLEAHVFGSYQGKAGYYIFTPFAPELDAEIAAQFIYINRGFVPQSLKNPEKRKVSKVDGIVSVTGLFRAPEKTGGLAGMLKPDNDPANNVWHSRTPLDFASYAALEAMPVYIDSFGKETAAAWPKGGTTRLEFSNRHFEYALTWFGLAGALWSVFLASVFTRK